MNVNREYKVSVVIVTYNSEKHIFDCLESLFKYNDIGDDLEVIIVDNQSREFEKLQTSLKELYGDRIVVVQNDRNGGYGQGNNVGIKTSSAPIVMIMNPDVRLVEPVFAKALTVFKNPCVVQYGMQQLDINGQKTFSIAVSSRIHPLFGLPLTSLCNKFGWFFQKIMYVSGACFFVRKSSFEKVGLFDERLFMFMEEDDIQYRLMKQKGNTIFYDTTAHYAHLHGLFREKKVDDFSYEENSLKNNLLVNEERGFSRESILNRRIVWFKMFIMKDKIRYMFNHDENTKNDIIHMTRWIEKMKALRDKS